VAGLPDWLTPLPDAETMRAVDRWAIEDRGVEGLALMERAGEAVARAVEELAPDGRVAVLCGKGNNGGDGLVVARLLRRAGRHVDVLLAGDPAELRGDALANLQRLPGEQPPGLEAAASILADAAIAVDALLGTGFAGEPRGEVGQAILTLAEAGCQVVAVDVPSGVDASTGTVASTAVEAVRTITFHAAKPGLWIRPGKAHAGSVEVADIGIPRGAPQAARVGLIEDSVLALLPRRDASSTKFRSGHVLVAGGSPGLTGAPTMAARAAMRAGAGYVTAILPAALQAIVASSGTPELMTRGLAEAEGALAEEAVPDVLEALARGGALALGPGLGRSEEAGRFARSLAAQAPVALVLDADGLGAYAGRLGELADRSHPTVLTPHAGELGRLLGIDSSEVERERLRHVREAAALAGAVVVLKGDDTLVARPDGLVAVSRGGSPGLATAGTGDVLSGVVATLLAQGLDALQAAAAGVLLHARAGRRAALDVGSPDAVVASDVIAALPRCRGPEHA
jgi:NAD(P)H-hydrate epimerase